MSLFGDIGGAISGVGHAASDVAHAGMDWVGGQAHAAGDLAGGALHAGADMAGGMMHAGGDMLGGMMHAGGDLMHGDVGGAIGHLGGGIHDAAGDLAHGASDAAGHMGHGVMDAAGDLAHGAGGMLGHLMSAGKAVAKEVMPGINTGKNILNAGKGIWNVLHGKDVAKSAESGLGGLNKLLGFDNRHKEKDDKDGLDHALDTTKGIAGGLKTAIELPTKASGTVLKLAETLEAGKLPGGVGGLLEKLPGLGLKEGALAEKLGGMIGPVKGLIEKGGEKLLAGPMGKFLVKEAETGALKLGGKLAGKLVPGLNIAMAGISAFESGRDAYDAFKKGDVFGGVVESLHTVTNLAGAIPGIGGVISVGGDLVAGAAHWLHDGGLKKMGDMAGAVGGAIGTGAKAVAGAVGSGLNAVGGAIGSGVKAVANSPVGKAVGGAVSAVGSGIKKVFSGW